jgi:hypothetical protein
MAAPVAHAAVSVALVPSSSTVAPGQEFTVSIRVTAAGSPFNAYQAIVRFDAAALTFLPASPLSLQEGAYMTAACGQTFHWFTSGTIEVGMLHSLLCAGQSLTGPGDVYSMRFRAAATPGATPLTFTMVEFANAGDPVTPVNAAGTSIVIAAATDAEPAPDARVALRAVPNPFNPSTTIAVRSDVAGTQTLAVYDAAGRRLRTLQHGVFAAGSRQVVWDGRGAGAARLPSGVYQVRLQAGDQVHATRVILLK